MTLKRLGLDVGLGLTKPILPLSGGGGGGDVPEWVPEGAIAFLDFVNGQYWTEAGGETDDPSTILQSDASDGDDWTPENIEAGVGYKDVGDGLAGSFRPGSLLTQMLSDGFTVAFENKLPATSSPSQFYCFAYDDPAFATAWEARYVGDGTIACEMRLADGVTPVTQQHVGFLDAINKVAWTLSATRLSASINGQEVITNGSPFTPNPPTTVTFYSYGGVGNVVRSIAVYPLKDDADLPAVSLISGPGSGSYVASAVHLGLNTAVVLWSELPSRSRLTISQWLKMDDAAIATFPVIVGQDIVGNVEVGFVNDTDIGGAINPFPPTGSDYLRFDTGDGLFTADNYHHSFLTIDTGFDTPNKKVKYYLDGVERALSINDLGSAFTIGSNGLGFGFPDTAIATTQAMDVCDPQVWFGRYIDPDLHIDKFRDPVTGKPVDPLVAASLFGPQSILYSGDALSFATNQGQDATAYLVTSATTTGSNGAGPVACSNATIGAAVVKVQWVDFGANTTGFISEEFEATISVNGQIQQISENDNSALTIFVYLANGTITNTTTSPSD